MKNAWATSVWLAALMAVLAWGVAHAQLSLVIEPQCVQCCPLEGLGPCPGYGALVTSEGWGPGERLNLLLTGPGPAGPFRTGFLSADDQGQLGLELIFLCQNPWLSEDEATVQIKENYWWLYPEWTPADFGQWRLDVNGETGSVVGRFVFARECPSAEEFVPEPGAIVLVSSGLAGMAAYAAARRRPRRG